MKRSTIALLLLLRLIAGVPSAARAAESKVEFSKTGIAFVNGRAFFPIGIWIYAPDDAVLKDVQAKKFNTIIGNAFNASHFDTILRHDMLAVPMFSEENLKAKDHPALLAWYLADEPENNQSPEQVQQAYRQAKVKDPNHPIGLCHFLFDAFAKFKDGSDFSMSDVYPVTANRDVPLRNVGIHMDQAREVHRENWGENWPLWTYIQIFGGPNTDGGKWAQPEPDEMRCMTYIALVHRANGILFFSYWPQAPRTWQAVGEINGELRQLTPWLLADGEERPARSSKEQIQIRAKKTSTGWLILAVNTERSDCETTLTIDGLGRQALRMPFNSNAAVRPVDGSFQEKFSACEVKVYGAGTTPPPPARPGHDPVTP